MRSSSARPVSARRSSPRSSARAACRRRHSVHFAGADWLFKRLKATRLDKSHETDLCKVIGVELLVVDDRCLQAMDATETADFYELVVERHHRAATLVTSNGTPDERLALMADPMLAQSAVGRLPSAAYELVIEGESLLAVGRRPASLWRAQRRLLGNRPAGGDVCGLDSSHRLGRTSRPTGAVGSRLSLATGNRAVPSGWQMTDVRVG